MSSCCSTKQIAQTKPKNTELLKPLTVEEIPTIEKDNITQTVEVIDNNGKVIVGVETIEEADDILKALETEKQTQIFNHSSWNNLLQKHVTNHGVVNYKGFKKDAKILRNYIASLGELKPNDDWTKQEKLAYWINAYNAMTIDLILRNYPINSIKDIDKPWEQRLWKLGNKWYNLDEIEHQIIRKMNEPRIHFALVCAAKSCPKLHNKAFTGLSLENDLTMLTKGFLADKSKNDITQNNLKLSKIFKWFAKDFKIDGSLIDFLNQYTDVNISDKAKKSFKDYNWYLNE
ncbi:uncharacterized protein DUF547 [Ichthyenterobacterium magnum]|uniref:Uncharacterized protein DUF547 n=2 Tax=Ichthyenterobacterium magnum TaxID=1230530 RepID=A0A420DW05_9FLAO|nr:uncharacterized protein DUF547 [Ichthyenterobacterium magnum]